MTVRGSALGDAKKKCVCVCVWGDLRLPRAVAASRRRTTAVPLLCPQLHPLARQVLRAHSFVLKIPGTAAHGARCVPARWARNRAPDCIRNRWQAPQSTLWPCDSPTRPMISRRCSSASQRRGRHAPASRGRPSSSAAPSSSATACFGSPSSSRRSPARLGTVLGACQRRTAQAMPVGGALPARLGQAFPGSLWLAADRRRLVPLLEALVAGSELPGTAELPLGACPRGRCPRRPATLKARLLVGLLAPSPVPP